MSNNGIAAIYARVSTREQAKHGYSLEMQIDRVQQYFNLYPNIDVQPDVEVFREEGGSGRSLERPRIQEVIELIKTGVVISLSVYKLDRLTRSVKDLQTILELVEEYNMRLISITEHIDTSTSMGRFVANQIISIAQLELENIFERTTEDIIGSARQVNYVYSGSPYGYTKDVGKLSILDDEAEIVRKVFSMYLDSNYSIRAISMILSSRKIGDRSWSEETISKMLKNEIYIGTYTVRDEVIEEHSPAIIEAEIFPEF